MNAGEIAKIYSKYPDQVQADTAFQTTLRNDFGYTGPLPKSVLGAIDPTLHTPQQQAPLANPQAPVPPPTSALMPPSIVPQPQQPPVASRVQESWGTPNGQIQQGAGGASRQQPIQDRGQGRGDVRGSGGFQQLLALVNQIRQRGIQL